MMNDRARAALKIAEQAAHQAQTLRQSLTAISSTEKSKGQFVTQADRDIEQFIRTEFATCFPGETILGEEFGGEIEQSGWTLDPIDGTANFINGLPLWAVAIGHYKYDNDVLLPDMGIIILPMLGLAIVGYDDELFVNGAPMTCPKAPVPTLSVGHRSLGLDDAVRQLAQDLEADNIAIYNWRSSSVSMGCCALGHISGHIQRCVSYWDLVPGAALCRAAGLHVGIDMHDDDALPTIKVCDSTLYPKVKDLWSSKKESSTEWI